MSGSIGGVIQTTGDSVLNVQNVNVVAAPVTDSAGGSLALENIEGLDYAALMGFMANGKLTDGVKSALKNACGNSVSQVVQNNLLLKAKLNDSNNLVELKSLSKYHSESNCDYFLELVVTFVNLNIEVYKKSGGYLDFEAFGIDIYIYSDSDLNNLILGPNTYTEKYYHQTNSASINTINGEYYVLVKKSSKSQSNVNTLNITTDDGSSPGGTGDVNNDGYLFKLNNKNWTIRVEN